MLYIVIVLVLIRLLIVGNSYAQKKRTDKAASKFKMNDKIDEQEFWKIIDYAFRNSFGNMKKEAQIITKKLSAYKPNEITNFEIILCEKLIKANDFKIIAIDKIIDGSVSDDTYLYFRCWLIGLGQETYEQTLKNPDYLADVIEKGVIPDFEDLLYVSTDAFTNKTGKEKEDETFPRNVADENRLNYDFGGPPTTGKDWKESELPKLYPKLWNKFN
jgi:hypothetical protein